MHLLNQLRREVGDTEREVNETLPALIADRERTLHELQT